MSQNAENRDENAVFESGTRLANPDNMQRGFTYKELTLLIGIVVAIVVAVIVLATEPAGTAFNATSDVIPGIKIPTLGARVIETAIEILF